MKLSLLTVLIPISGWAQNYSLFAGARSASLAHTSVTLTDIWASHHNQAGLAFIEEPVAAVSYQNRFLLRDLSLFHAALALPLHSGTMGLSISHFGFELYNQSKAGINYSRKFGPYFSTGIQINYERFYVSEGNSSGAVSFEVGVLGKPVRNISLAFHLYNPSGNYKNTETEERLPFTGRLGAQYRFSEEVFLCAEIRKEEQFPEQYTLGFEYQLQDVLALRTGVGIQPWTNAFGLGFNWDPLIFDIAYEYRGLPGSNLQLSVQYEL